MQTRSPRISNDVSDVSKPEEREGKGGTYMYDSVSWERLQYGLRQAHAIGHETSKTARMYSAHEAFLNFSLPAVLRVSAYITFSTLLVLLFFYHRPPFPSKVPKLSNENYPIVGAIRFFYARWDFFKDARTKTDTGNFTFHIGKYPIVGMSGDVGRQVFFGSSSLSMTEG